MESIAPKERFYPCPYCNYLVSSELAECENCGLEVSGDGIDDLVRTEKAKTAAINDASTLKHISVVFAGFSLLTNFILTANSIFVMFLLEGGLFIFGLFIWKLIRWHQNHSYNEFELDTLKEAKKEKKTAIAISMIAFGIIAFSIWINL